MSFPKFSSTLARVGAASAALLAPAIAFAQQAAPAAADAAATAATAAAPVVDKGDTAFMFIATILVLFMLVPGLALFYGGLVRSKNMLSVLMQCTMIGAVVMLIWVIYGYSFAFGGGTSPYWGGTAKMFLMGVNTTTTAATFSKGVVIPEFIFMLFQMTFAAITPALIIGAYAERIKFSASVLFCALWATFVYFPIAHMVWDSNGFLFKMGALDFAGGTVVHINAGIAGICGALLIGKRTGYGKDMMAPHSMTLTFIATAAAIVSWSVVETFTRGKASMLGGASGMVAGLVAITPAAGIAGPMGAIVMGLIVSPLCYFFVSVVKNKFGYDDTADVFGVHCVGGIFGALATGIFASASLGGVGYADGVTMSSQFMVQLTAVITTIVWCGVGSIILYKIVDVIVGLRVTVEAEREGLDLASHGEAAYHTS
jgi:Amt family ammonium transporter